MLPVCLPDLKRVPFDIERLLSKIYKVGHRNDLKRSFKVIENNPFRFSAYSVFRIARISWLEIAIFNTAPVYRVYWSMSPLRMTLLEFHNLLRIMWENRMTRPPGSERSMICLAVLTKCRHMADILWHQSLWTHIVRWQWPLGDSHYGLYIP